MSKKVYLIRAAQFYKIGISHNITKRLGAVQTGCPIKCEYVGYFPSSSPEQLEKDLHLAFQDFKTWGEWFDLGDDNIRKLITDWNLKHVINPYAETTQETERTAQSSALKDAREITALVNEISRLYTEIYPVSYLNDQGKAGIRGFIVKYGFDVVAECIKHASASMDHTTIFSKLPYVLRNYSKYGRHVDSKTWQLYSKVKQAFDRDSANDLLKVVMVNDIDLSDDKFKLLSDYADTLISRDTPPNSWVFAYMNAENIASAASKSIQKRRADIGRLGGRMLSIQKEGRL